MSIQQPMQPTKSKVVAGLLGIILGGIGAHHFYLGNILRGVLYLLFSWTVIPAVIGFIEGIIYLATPDQAWAAKYGVQPMVVQISTPVPARSRDAAAQLTDLAKLKEQGVITDEEFESKKRELLG